MNPRTPIEDMTDEQFERWMRRNSFRGMAAYAMSAKRRRKIEAKKGKTP